MRQTFITKMNSFVYFILAKPLEKFQYKRLADNGYLYEWQFRLLIFLKIKREE